MFSLSAIGTWLLSYGLGAVLKFASDALGNYLSQRHADANAKEVGRVTAERSASEASRQATERELEAAQNAPQSTDEAIKRLEDGSA